MKNIFFETMNSITLIVYYEGDSFSDAVDAIGSRYEFITEPPEGMSEVSADVNVITFKVVDNDSSHYPWWFMSVGVDTENQRIIYLYHVDIETQKIEDLEVFIKDSYNLDGI